MKFVINIVLIALLTYLAQMLGPWWIIFVSAGLVGLLIQDKGFNTFAAGFIAVFVLWFLQSYLIDVANESILSSKIVELFPVVTTPIHLMLVTAFIGGLCGGFAALTGKLFGSIFQMKKVQHTVYR